MRRLAREISAIVGFALLALGVAWPLPVQLTTALTGAPTGDTGVYVWNLWIFQHELLKHGQFPLFTDHIFALGNVADLSAHNYTIFADLLGLPLIPMLGVVGAFNVIYLLLIASSGYGAYLLVRRLTGGSIEAWMAGAAFAASPVLVARGAGHFSLVAAAPLPVFVLCTLRALETRRLRSALLAGAVAGWAGYCDVYFPIYCVLMAAVIVAHRQWRITRSSVLPRRGAVRTATVLIGAAVAVIGFRLWHGEATLTVFGRLIELRTLYTPVFVLTGLAIWRTHLQWRPRLAAAPDRLSIRTLAGLIAAGALSTAAVLSPVLIALGRRLMTGRFPAPPLLWRSSPPGLDLLALVLPNPNQPWFGGPSRAWITALRADAFPEFVGSLSLVAIGVIAVALWRSRRAVPRFWMLFTLVFVLLSLGPFVQVDRITTAIPGPWALLRYVPVIGLARAPSRFAIVATLGLTVCLGFALTALRRAWPGRERLVLAGAAALLAVELLPSPRPLFDATVPAVYSVIAADTDESKRVLELPGGIRDGTFSLGDFNASAEFFQTVHRKPIIGGYLSRVADHRRQESMQIPALAALYTMSEGRPVAANLTREALATRDGFLATACVGYVVIDRDRASPELASFATRLFDLVEVGEDHGRELLVPSHPPASGCARIE